MTGLVHRLAALAILIFGLALLSAPAEAAPSCRQLEARLARALPAANSKTSKKYDDAIARQSDQIAKTRQRIRNSGCGFALFARNGAQCRELNATIGRMEANLKSLTSTRAKLAKNAKQPDRTRILAALEAGGCRSGKNPTPIKTAASPTMDLALPAENNAGVTIRGTSETALYYPASRPYPTQCVRICDGYFFPMSKSSAPADFQRDQARCEAACPGTRVEMFYGGNPQNPSGMISAVTGKSYASLPTALVFRRLDIPTEPGCSCRGSTVQASSFFGQAPATGTRITENPGSSLISVKDTADTQKAAKPTMPQPTEDKNLTDDRKVRVVGPAFLPAQ